MSYLWASVYILIGFGAGWVHWWKKRYVDKTTRSSFIGYLKHDPATTWAALSTIVVGEVSLATAHVGDGLSLTQFVAAVGAGYIPDSAINRAPKGSNGGDQ